MSDDDTPTSDTDDETRHPEPVGVAAFGDIGEAEVAQAKLAGYGIESALQDEVEGGTLPVQGEGPIVVMVRAADADDATRILSEPAAPIEAVDPGDPGEPADV